MDSRVESIAGLYEIALRRIRSFDDESQVMKPEAISEMTEQRTADEDFVKDTSEITSAIPYERALAISRTAISCVMFRNVGSISPYEQEALEATYRFVTGPLLEISHDLDQNKNRHATESGMYMLRDSTRQIQSLLVDCGILPPNDNFSEREQTI